MAADAKETALSLQNPHPKLPLYNLPSYHELHETMSHLKLLNLSHKVGKNRKSWHEHISSPNELRSIPLTK